MMNENLNKTIKNGYRSLEAFKPLKDKKTGKYVNDIGLFYLMGKEIEEKERIHKEQGNKLPYVSNKYSIENVEFAKLIKQLVDSKQYTMQELIEYYASCVRVNE